MQLHDRLRLLVVLDSVGEHEGIGRLYHSMGLPQLNPVLSLWASNKDRDDKRRHDYRKQVHITSKKRDSRCANYF